ncbi:FAD binding domain-containing protein [Leptodontidium sp. 2 PMI_412]|nr:FAD binding domain-containing protein [Leptodontidium sp. 2 PMI_412]
MFLNKRFTTAALGALLSGKLTTGYPGGLCSALTRPSNDWDAQTTVAFPNSAANHEPTYSAVISPATEGDVAKAVKIANSINLPFLGTGGRHSSAVTLGDLQEGLAIDLSKLNSVQVDAENGTLTIGGGVRFGDITDPVYEVGYQMPIGSCVCPGMIGATVGGGVGRWQGVDGLIIDRLMSVRLVTARGTLIDVSENSHPELFWAIRGAAPNFGIITSATYQLAPQLNKGQVLSADFVLPASSSVPYFDLLESLSNTMPAELSTISIMVYNDTVGAPQILVGWVYIGPEDEGRELIAPILDLNPTYTSISTVAYNELNKVALRGLGTAICSPTVANGYAANFRNLSSSTYQEVFQTLSDFYIDHPGGRSSSVEIEIFSPQAVEAVAVDATAYPWRESKGYV